MTFSQIRVLKSSSFLDGMFLQIQDISMFQHFRNKNRINYFVKKITSARWARAVDNSLENKHLNGFFKIYQSF